MGGRNHLLRRPGPVRVLASEPPVSPPVPWPRRPPPVSAPPAVRPRRPGVAPFQRVAPPVQRVPLPVRPPEMPARHAIVMAHLLGRNGQTCGSIPGTRGGAKRSRPAPLYLPQIDCFSPRNAKGPAHGRAEQNSGRTHEKRRAEDLRPPLTTVVYHSNSSASPGTTARLRCRIPAPLRERIWSWGKSRCGPS